jgi:acyl-CoA hydrolase
MPRPKDGVTLPLECFDHVIDAPAALPEFADNQLDARFAAIGRHIAGIVEAQSGPTLQLGLGKVQQAVLEALKAADATDLKLHAGMVSTPLLGLLEAGKMSAETGAITCGVALGGHALYEEAASDSRFRFREVGHTHAAATLAAIPGLIAINSAIEVDLFGQANAEFIGDKQVSGGGGLTDFLAGAQASDGGLAVIALNATAKGGALSRIVPRLSAPAVTVPRTLVDCVVTEHGIARLTGLDLEDRAKALIEIAAPEHRDRLSNDWATIRSAM